MGKRVECPECGDKYIRLGTHWTGSCSPPELTDRQKDIIVGLMMGDGTLSYTNRRNPRIEVNMISPNYLEYLDEIFGCLSTGVRLKQTAAESAQMNRDRGFSPNAKEENYSNVYRWKTRCLEELHNFNWYEGGKKVWPEDINLTPTVLKHWYVGDGYFNNHCRNKRISIGASNEVGNEDKISSYFKQADLPLPSNYCTQENKKFDIQFSNSQSEELWEYMGDPLPDFQYKWPEEYR